MYIMNLIHDICLTKNDINNTPKWRFIKKKKQIEKLEKITTEFLNLDIFSASENMLTFLLSLEDKITIKINEHLWGFDDHLVIELWDNDNEKFLIYYYPKSNRFEMYNNKVSYTIYRNTKTSNRINKMWKPLIDIIMKKYLDYIIQTAEYISLMNNGGDIDE